jgi:MFS family permease
MRRPLLTDCCFHEYPERHNNQWTIAARDLGSVGVLSAMIADTCPPDRRGTAFGLFNLFSTLALLLANLIARLVWEEFGPRATFMFGGAIALSSMLPILTLLYRAFVTQRD